MTAEEYRCEGYDVSVNLGQSVIDHAEQVIVQAYVEPMCAGSEPTMAAIRRATMALSHLYLSSALDIKATPAGGKVKTTAQSVQPSAWQAMSVHGSAAVMLLKALNPAKQWWAVCDDILGLAFNTNYINL